MSNKNWHVAVATQNGHERLARVELDEHGFDVHVPIEYVPLKLHTGRKHVTADRLLLTPYFFVRFDTEDDEEYSLVLAQRGVHHVLTNSRSRPSPISSRIIAEHRSREYREQHSATKRREKTDNTLPLNTAYRILRGTGEGHTGILIAVDRGVAHLDINGMVWMPSVGDIQMVQQGKGAA